MHLIVITHGADVADGGGALGVGRPEVRDPVLLGRHHRRAERAAESGPGPCTGGIGGGRGGRVARWRCMRIGRADRHTTLLQRERGKAIILIELNCLNI